MVPRILFTGNLPLKIAVTRLAGKEKSDASRCARYGHVCYSVHPLRSELRGKEIAAFVDTVHEGKFDCIFFTSALPAKIIGPLLRTFPRVIAIGPQTAKELEQHKVACETLGSFYSKDLVPYLGDWVRGKHIGIPRADVPNPALLDAITAAGGIVHEFRCYGLEPTGEQLATGNADAILFTSAMSYTKACWTPRPGLLVMAIGDITAATMRAGGTNPEVVGDGSLDGTLKALNAYIETRGVPGMENHKGPAETGPEEPVHLWSHAGIIVIDKPRGPSSHEVAAWVGKMLGCQVGHSGTLDPQVSGVLLIMLGNAVRLAPLLLQHDKEYVCLMRLHGRVDRAKIDQMATEFTGRLYQRPPRKSAVKRNLRIREIRKLEILDVQDRLVLFKAECDAGTYIRSLCHHMGLALGVGAHMVELIRTRSGSFATESMHTLHEVQDAAVAARNGDRSAVEKIVLSVDKAVPELPLVVIRDAAIDAVCHGAKLAGLGVISAMPFEKGQTVAVLSQKQEFICLGQALVPSASFRPGDTGLVIAPTSVFMAPGTYPRTWTKSDKVWPEKKKRPRKPPAKPPGRSGLRPDRRQPGGPDRRPDNRFRKRG
jgi:tRNA pseudouridine55 synthase/H/ACA ribonucleoprotein complex subunit 4